MDVNRLDNYFSLTTTSRVTLPEANLFAFGGDAITSKEPHLKHEETITDKFIIGRNYVLNDIDLVEVGEECNVYKLVGIIKEINGITFNSLIMKPIKTSSSLVFSLSKQDCKKIGIDYEEGLQLFPLSLDWQILKTEDDTTEHVENREFNPNDLSTYPVDEETNTIKKMMIRLTGFEQLSNSHIKTPLSPYSMSIKDFIETMSVNFKPHCKPQNYDITNVKARISVRDLNDFRANIFVDSSNSIFIEVDFSYKDMSTDKEIGIPVSFFANKSINDFLTVSWIQPHTRNVRVSSPYYGEEILELDERDYESLRHLSGIDRKPLSTRLNNILKESILESLEKEY